MAGCPMLPRAALSAYIEELCALCAPRGPSSLLANLELLHTTIQGGNGRNGVEARLIRLCDRFPAVKNISASDLRVLVAYHTLVGGRHCTLGEGGEIIDQWASGVDHAQAAKALGIRGRTPAITARKRYVTALKKLGLL